MDNLDNKTISMVFERLAQLMEIHGQNPFRSKAIASAAYKINKLPFSVSDKTTEELSQTPGIGVSTANKITTILQTGDLPELAELLAITPAGIVDMLQIKGLGPKKIQVIWKELGLETVGEVYYACNENRLATAKGIGLKTQEQIKKAIEFTFANKGLFRYASAETVANQVFASIKARFQPDTLLSFTGEYRRKNETLNCIALLVDTDLKSLIEAINSLEGFTPISDQQVITTLTEPLSGFLTVDNQVLHYQSPTGIKFQFIASDKDDFYKNLLMTTGSSAHVKALIQLLNHPESIPALKSEQEIYQAAGLEYIEPELRENLGEIELAGQKKLPKLITLEDLKGSLHNHSTYSDGVHTLREMALYAKDTLGLEYFGICDHSKIAVYANGLSIERVQEQWEEIEKLNIELAPFRIFKGIESDILADGSLDYPNEILTQFDFVVASIHSNLKMDIEKATERLIRAIENPFTTILGHPTGRLLLAREGYAIDHKKVIDACAAHQVVIEINANPLRLDLDWRWHRYAVDKGVLLSINPDAHRTSGLHDMQYGVWVARKGGLSPAHCLNSYSVTEIAHYFSTKKASNSI